jgi:hypothetical protein
MIHMFHVLFGFALAYLVASLSESYLHRTVGHADPRVRQFWRRYPRLFRLLLKAYYRHAVVHHGLTYRDDHITQFRDPADKARVDRIVEEAADALIERERYGLTIVPRGFLTYNVAVIPLVAVLYWSAGFWVSMGALPVLTFAPLLSMVFHPYFHLPHRVAIRSAPKPVAFLLTTWYFRSVWRNHYLHHKYLRCNYNLLLGGDLILGTSRTADPTDLEAIKSLGIPSDAEPSHPHVPRAGLCQENASDANRSPRSGSGWPNGKR